MRNIRNRHKRINYMNSFIFRVPVFESRVPYILKVLSPTLWSWVSGPESHLWNGSRVALLGSQVLVPGSYLRDVSGLGFPKKSRVSGPTSRICPTDVCRWLKFQFHEDFVYYDIFLRHCVFVIKVFWK